MQVNPYYLTSQMDNNTDRVQCAQAHNFVISQFGSLWFFLAVMLLGFPFSFSMQESEHVSRAGRKPT